LRLKTRALVVEGAHHPGCRERGVLATRVRGHQHFHQLVSTAELLEHRPLGVLGGAGEPMATLSGSVERNQRGSSAKATVEDDE
jgi:hypothetical protein